MEELIRFQDDTISMLWIAVYILTAAVLALSAALWAVTSKDYTGEADTDRFHSPGTKVEYEKIQQQKSK